MNRRVLLLTPLLLACGPWFYTAPPPLASYPRRIPAKHWSHLLQEVHPIPASASNASVASTIADCRTLAAGLPSFPVADRFAKIDALIQLNREGGAFSAIAANFLLELRELAADDATLAASRDYLVWRSGDSGDPAPSLAKPPVMTWNTSEENYASAVAAYRAKLDAFIDEAGTRLQSAPGPLAPNYRTQQAAAFFLADSYDEAIEKFAAVIKEFPTHPRAEVAAFMLGRCYLEKSRKAAHDATSLTPGAGSLLHAAADAFHHYLAQYPQGRFVPDAHGWLGAIEVDKGNFGEAIARQLDRLAVRASRETESSVLRECDRLFARIFALPEEGQSYELLAASLPWDAIARRPEIARLFIGRALDPAAADNDLPPESIYWSGDTQQLDYIHRRVIRPQAFARQALDLLGKAVLALGNDATTPPGDAFSSLVLGSAAMSSGHAEQALALYDRGLATTGRDDLLQGRAIALTALGRHPEAAATYATMAAEFPDSHLTQQSRFDHAISLYHAGNAGEAFLDLLPPIHAAGDASEDAPSLHPPHEPTQWLDIIAQFAPLDQLAAPLDLLPPNDPHTVILRAVVRGRALAAERFDLAARCIDPAGTDQTLFPHTGYREVQRPDYVLMDQARWDQDVAPLAALCRQRDRSPASPQLQLEIGRLWKSLRGRLTLPLQNLLADSGSETEKTDQLRAVNAAFLGIPAETIAIEIASRDELQHALTSFLAASGSPDPAIAAPALEEANEAIFRLAEFSLYALDRAVVDNRSTLSARLVARLKTEFPTSPEATRAVPWSFTPLSEKEVWMPGDYNPGNAAATLIYSLSHPEDSLKKIDGTDYLERHYENDENRELEETSGGPADLTGSFANLTPTPPLDLATVREKLAGGLANLSGAGFALGAAWDDLSAAASLPGITPELFHDYANLRLTGSAPPPLEGEWLPLKPIFDYRIQVRALERHYFQGDRYQDRIIAWQAYLDKYPNGPKTEAATFQLLRARIWSIRPQPQIRAFFLPRSPILAGYKHLMFQPVPGDGLPPLTERIQEISGYRDRDRQNAETYRAKAANGYSPADYYESSVRYENAMLDEMSLELTRPASGDPTPAELLIALKDFEARYPASRYLPDLHVMRASLLADAGDPVPAVADLVAFLNDSNHPELHHEAALRFAEIAQRLLDPAQRPAVATAFRTNPAALTLLKNLVHGDTCLFRLRPMLPWLEAN
jgi:TolA-binding protein